MYKVGDLVTIVDVVTRNALGVNGIMEAMLGQTQKIRRIDGKNIELDQGYKWQAVHIRLATEEEMVDWEAEVAPEPVDDIPVWHKMPLLDLPPVAAKKVKPPKPVKRKNLYSLLKEEMDGESGTVSYALRFKKREDKFHAKDVCNARMKWEYGANPRIEGDEMTEIVMDVKVAITNYFKKDLVGEKNFKQYMKYILNDSPWASCFITKRVSDAIQHGVKFNLGMDVSALIGAAIALREGWEYKPKLNTFAALMKKGYSGNVSYLVSAYMRQVGDKWTVLGMNSGHHVLSVGMEWEDLRKFFREGYSPADKPIRTNAEGSYRVFNRIARTEGVVENVTKVFARIGKAKVVGEGWGREVILPDNAGIVLADALTIELK